MLTYRKHVERTALKCKKCQSVMKDLAAKGIEQRHLFLLYQSMVLSVTDYGLGLTTMAQTNLLKLDRVQNEAMRVILGTVLDGSSRGLNTASMSADRAQANQGVGKVPKPIPASVRDIPARKLGKALSRMVSRQNRVRDQASHSRKQQTVRPHSHRHSVH